MTQKRTIHPLFLFLVLGCGLLSISFSAILIRWSQANGLVVAFWRVSFSLLFMSFFWFRKKKTLDTFTIQEGVFFLLSGICLGIHFGSWISSLQYTSVSISVLLVTTNPLWIGLFSVFVLKKKLSNKMWMGISFGLMGSILISLGSSGKAPSPNAFLGNSLALLGSFSASAYLLLGRKLREKFSLVDYAFFTLLGAWLMLGILVFLSPHSFFHYPPKEWLLFFLMALFPQMIGHNSINWSLKYLSATTLSLLLLSEPIGSSFFAYLLLNESPSLMTWLGTPFLLLGIAIVLFFDKKNSSSV